MTISNGFFHLIFIPVVQYTRNEFGYFISFKWEII